MTTSTPDPTGSGETRISPDRTVVVIARDTKHFRWRGTDGHDYRDQDVADWAPLVPVSPAPDTDDELLKRARLAISDPASVLPKDHGDAERPAETTSNWAARAVIASVVAGLRADLGRARAERDELTREVERLNDEVQSYQGDGAYERGHEHGMNAQARSCVRDLLDALQLGPMPDRPLDTVWTTLLKIVSEQEANRHATAMAGVRDRLEVKRLRAELARVSGDRTIPDDAAERLACALFRVARTPFQDSPEAPLNNLGLPLWRHQWRDLSDKQRAEWVGYANRVLPQVLADLGATPTTDHLTWSVVHVPPGTTDPEDRDTPITPGWWVLGVDSEAPEHPVVQVHLGETLPPTTGPAPAAADVQWGVQRADGVLDQRDDEADAREHLHWFDPGTARVVSRTVVYGPWTPAPVAPQAPAEPTATPDGVAEIRAAQIAALTSQDASRVDCSVRAPLTDGQMRRLLLEIQNLKDEGHHAGHTLEMLLDPKLGELLDDITEFGPLLAAPPVDDCNDNLTAGFLRPSAPTEEKQ